MLKNTNAISTKSYAVFVVDNKVTLAKDKKTGRFVKIAIAQAEYDAMLLKQAKNNLVSIQKTVLNSLSVLFMFLTVLTPFVLCALIIDEFSMSLHDAILASGIMSVLIAPVFLVLGINFNDAKYSLKLSV